MVIIDNMRSPRSTADNAKATYVCHDRSGNMTAKYKDLHPLLMNLREAAPMAKILLITHLNDTNIHTSSRADILLINQVKNKPA